MAKDLSDFGDSLDEATFSQILEMDDDGDMEFSRSIVFGFFQQAEQTFDQMDEKIKEAKPDLNELSQLGHFLKGSSATLGLTKLRDHCEHIQNYGSRKDANGEDVPDRTDKEWLEKIKSTVEQAKKEYAFAEEKLKAYYAEEAKAD